MPLYRPSELLQFLESIGAEPKKGLSQNFLIDGNILKNTVKAADLKSGDLVVEVGPGPGALTEELLAADVSVIAIEQDRVFASALARLQPLPGRTLTVFHQDALQFDIETEIRKRLPVPGKAVLIANLPYHITTPLISRFAHLDHCISSLVIMVQDEVARRICARPSVSDYGSLSVFVNFFATPQYSFKVSRNCFFPPPKVDSAVVRLDLKPVANVDQDQFFLLTRTAFNHRRKMLRASLSAIYTSKAVEYALEKIGKAKESRPENLSCEDFLELYRKLEK